MFINNSHEFVYILATSLTMLGVISICAGIIMLVSKASGKAVQSIATQTARLAQKGITEEIAGLVGNRIILDEHAQRSGAHHCWDWYLPGAVWLHHAGVSLPHD